MTYGRQAQAQSEIEKKDQEHLSMKFKWDGYRTQRRKTEGMEGNFRKGTSQYW